LNNNRKTEESLTSLNEELQATVQRLASSNRELRDFAHTVAHDLKAPLRGIRNLVDWMLEDCKNKLDKQSKVQLGLIAQQAERMSALIDGVLSYSEVGRVSVKVEKVDLYEVVKKVIAEIAPPENIVITVESQLPVVECEETRIIQVFQNLLNNAVKYMDKPQGQVRIGCVEENGFWKFSVSDNGPGIEEKYFEKIFKIFQTLSPRDEVEATGIGLSVVKKIIEMYGGRIWVESELNKGSTFLFTFPKSHNLVKNDTQLLTSSP